MKSKAWQKLRLNQLIEKPEKAFLLISCIFGTIFVFIFPPFQVIDEPSHFFRAYQLAQGEVIGIKKDDMTGGYLPSSVVHAPDKYSRLVFQYQEKAKLQDIKNDLKTPLKSSEKEFMLFNNTVVYPPLTYLPQTIAVKISSLFNASPLLILYFTRIASLVFWIILIYWAIKLLPVGKWFFVVVGTFPMMLTQAASASSDATINALTVFTISVIIALAFKDWGSKVNARLLWTLVACGFVLSLVKLPTLFILLLCFIIPADRFKSLLSKWKFLTIFALLVAAIALLWNYFALHLRVELRPDISSINQLHFILANPFEFIKLFIYYPLQVRFDQTIMQMYGWLGWNEVKLPLWLALIGFGFAFLSLMEPAFKKIVITRWMRTWAVAVFALICFAITSLLYLTWMPVGFGQLYDLWGRYYVALLPIFIVIAGGIFYIDASTWKKVRLGILVLTPISLTIVTILVINRYYWSLPLG